MKKRTLACLLAVTTVALLTGCGRTTDETPQETNDETNAETMEETTEETDTAPSADEMESIAGTYTASYDGSTLTIATNGDVEVSIYRLCDMTGSLTGITGSLLDLSLTDPNGGDMIATFDLDTKEFVVTGSTWELLPEGESFTFDE